MFTLGTILMFIGVFLFVGGFIALFTNTDPHDEQTAEIATIVIGAVTVCLAFACVFIGLGMSASKFADDCEAKNGIAIEDYTVCIDSVTGAPIDIPRNNK
jgi:hypothetical protein